MHLKSLSASGVILASLEADVGEPPEEAGRPAHILLPADGKGGLTHISARVLWSRTEDGGRRLFGLELTDPSLRVRRALEAHLSQFPKDLKDLWDHWDQLQEEPAPPPVLTAAPPLGPEPTPTYCRVETVMEQGRRDAAPASTPASDLPLYLVGLGGVAAGLGLFCWGPEPYQIFGAILAIYGSLAIAGRSVWTMWRRAAAPHLNLQDGQG